MLEKVVDNQIIAFNVTKLELIAYQKLIIY